MDKEKVYEKDMHAVLVSFLSFQSIAHKDDDEMKFKGYVTRNLPYRFSSQS